MRAWIAIAFVGAAACGTSRSGPDANLYARCQALEDDFEAALAEGPGSCTTDADCTLIGGQFGSWCDCLPSIGPWCGGNPIAVNAPGLVRAEQAVSDFARDCVPIGARAICDCGPSTDLHCTSGTCGAYLYNSCFAPLPDASTPDASPPDAAP